MNLSVDVVDFSTVSKPIEERLIGALMRYPQSLVAVQEHLSAADFYSRECGALYALMMRRAGDGVLPDEFDLPIAAQRQISGLDLGWLFALQEDAPTRAYVPQLIERVLHEAAIRRATFGALQMCRDLQESGCDVEAVTATAAEQLLARASDASDGLMPSAVPQAMEASLQAGQGYSVAYSSGLDAFDVVLKFRPGKLYVIAARPGMGKSALAMQIVQAADIEGDRSNWGVISLEMSTAELTGRLICREAQCDTKRFTDGTVNATVWQRCVRAADQVQGYPVRIDDRSGLTWAQIAGKARKWSLLHGLQGLVIDYAQLIRKRDPRMSNNDHVTEVSQGAKALAKSLDIPVLLLSQLNRQCEQRQDKRPMCSDLRDSGSLEQDADVVLMLYREDVYRAADEANDNAAEVIIRKHRGGPCGTIRLNWSGYCARFDDLHVYGD